MINEVFAEIHPNVNCIQRFYFYVFEKGVVASDGQINKSEYDLAIFVINNYDLSLVVVFKSGNLVGAFGAANIAAGAACERQQ